MRTDERQPVLTATRRCASPRCRRDPRTDEPQPRPAAPGARLCRVCHERLRDRLAAAPELFDEAAHALNATVKTSERVSGGRKPGIPLNSRAVEARAALRGLLAAWSELVADERRVAPPPRTVPAMAAFLGLHLDWLARHPAVGDLADELSAVAAELTRLTQTDGSWRVVVARCSHHDCDGDLEAWMQPRDSRLASEIKCTRNKEHVWPAQRWGSLRRYLTAVSHPPRKGSP